MASPNLQYANIPPFQYQKFGERHYQGFDRQTLKFSYYPIIHRATSPLAQENNTDCADAESKKEGDSDNPAAVDVASDQTTPVSTDDPSLTDSGGKCIDFLVIFLFLRRR
jgi:hypothetical protein